MRAKRTVRDPEISVGGKFVKNGLVNSRFVPAEVARDVRYDVTRRDAGLESSEDDHQPRRDRKRRSRSVAFYDIVAAFVHTTIDEVVAVLLPTACWNVMIASGC